MFKTPRNNLLEQTGKSAHLLWQCGFSRDQFDLSTENKYGQNMLTLFHSHCLSVEFESIGLKAGINVTEMLLSQASHAVQF
jgi:hypothetical protein